MRLLLSKGARVDADGGSALAGAAGGGSHEIARLLLERGAQINAIGYRGNTALMVASRYGRATMVSLLLSKGAQVNIRNTEGFTALMAAVGGGWTNKGTWYDPTVIGSVEVVRLLLNKGAEVNIKTNGGATALILAAGACRWQEVIGRRGNLERELITNDPEKIAIVGLLLAKGAQVNAQSSQGTTALMMAVRTGAVATIRLLLSKGADVNPGNKEGDTALKIAQRIKSFPGMVSWTSVIDAPGIVGLLENARAQE